MEQLKRFHVTRLRQETAKAAMRCNETFSRVRNRQWPHSSVCALLAANAESLAKRKRGQIAKCPRQRIPQHGLPSPIGTQIASPMWEALLHTSAAKWPNARASGYPNHRASGYPDAVAEIWTSTTNKVSCVCRSQPQTRPRHGNTKRANIHLASRNPEFAEATKNHNEPFSARAKHRAPHANICWPQARGKFVFK